MTRAELIQTILRSEVMQWRTMTKDQLLECLIVERKDVLDELSHDTLVYICQQTLIWQMYGPQQSKEQHHDYQTL
jgi:hypothetical protein